MCTVLLWVAGLRQTNRMLKVTLAVLTLVVLLSISSASMILPVEFADTMLDEFEDDTAGDNANYEQLEWIVAKRGLTKCKNRRNGKNCVCDLRKPEGAPGRYIRCYSGSING